MASFRSSSRWHHPRWVKLTHWLGTLAFLLLLFTGAEMVMVHPRFYWGDVGNDLTPALFELPVSRNYQHGGWEKAEPFFADANSPVSASRTYDIFNQNGWGRSLHFLSAWVLLFSGLLYTIIAIMHGHVRRKLWPEKGNRNMAALFRDVADHFRKEVLAAYNGHYGLLQRLSYLGVLFILAPMMVLTGLTMSPAVTASHPWLLWLFGGAQSARTLHFFSAILLTLFLLVHLVMLVRTGFKRQMISMTISKSSNSGAHA